MHRLSRHTVLDLLGALLLTALVFLPGDSLSESDRSHDADIEPADSHQAAETPEPLQDSDLGASSPWYDVAERLEVHRDYRGVVNLMDRVVRRESGLNLAEARLWRAAFAGRRGFLEIAGAEIDSLTRESAAFPVRLRLAVMECAIDLALERNDMPGAVEAWRLRAACLDSLGGAPVDTIEADLHYRLGTALLTADVEPAEAARHLEEALTLGLPGEILPSARFNYGLALSRSGSLDQAMAVFESLLDDAGFLSRHRAIAGRAMVELADDRYEAGDYAESRRRYESALPFAASGADSGWIVLQLGEVAARLGAGREAWRRYQEYLSEWPAGTWAPYARAGAADLDTTNAIDGAGIWKDGEWNQP